MGETTHEIEAHIEETREELETHLQELGAKVKSVTDWRYQFQTNPLPMLSLAFAGGILLARMVGRRPRTSDWDQRLVATGRYSPVESDEE